MIWLVAAIFLVFASVILRGAPYLNSHKKAVEVGLDLLQLKPGQTIIDLGSGSGNVVKAAAKRGIKSIGYELNPILFVISWLNTIRYRHLVTIIWGDYWLKKLPPADGIYVFLMGRFMKKLPEYLQKNIDQPLRVVCYGFSIPGEKPVKEEFGFFVYNLKPVAKKQTKP